MTPDGDSGLNYQPDMYGHCIGLGIEAPWVVENQEWIIEPNMVIALEAFVGEPGVGATNFEHNLIVTETGVEVLDHDAVAPYRPWEQS